MFGAMAGDIIGSVYEFSPIKTTDFPLFQERSRFTDDSVLTVATAYCILNKGDYVSAFKHIGRRYPDSGYGGNFIHWLFSDATEPYNSWGNGSAMRVSPVGFAFDTMEDVLHEAQRSAEVTHNHPEGIKGAQATAATIFLSRTGKNKDEIIHFIENIFNYDLNRTLEDIRPNYRFDVSCQGTVPEAIIAFLESNDFEDAIRKAVSLGGDSDTLACITGGIAQAYYNNIPTQILDETKRRLPADLLEISESFSENYCPL